MTRKPGDGPDNPMCMFRFCEFNQDVWFTNFLPKEQPCGTCQACRECGDEKSRLAPEFNVRVT